MSQRTLPNPVPLTVFSPRVGMRVKRIYASCGAHIETLSDELAIQDEAPADSQRG